MRDPVQEKKRLEMIHEASETAWKFAMAQPGAYEDLVVVLADETDANATTLLNALGMEVQPARTDLGRVPASLIAVPRADAVLRLEPLDPLLSGKLGASMPLTLTVLVVACGGWSITSLRQNVGFA